MREKKKKKKREVCLIALFKHKLLIKNRFRDDQLTLRQLVSTCTDTGSIIERFLFFKKKVRGKQQYSDSRSFDPWNVFNALLR